MEAVRTALVGQQHGIQIVEDWRRFAGLEARLGGIAHEFDLHCRRKELRNMGRVAKMSVAATRAALDDAGLDDALLHAGKVSLFYGSTDGSTAAAEDYYRKLYTTDSFGGLLSSTYLKFMSHTCAANLAQVFGVTGRVVPICSACTSASQAIGEGYWSIVSGREEVSLCGGAEEIHATVAGVFDLMLATSLRYSDRPDLTPRPFDVDRDGMVVAEGAGTLVLESWDHAQARGARAYAELVGYGNNCDGRHLTNPSPSGMAGAMRRALEHARLDSKEIGYINAHGTGTEIGDVAESRATMEVLGDSVPISSTKSYTGHTLGGCGSIESILVLAMLENGFLAPTRNLDDVDPRCAPLDYIRGEVREARPELVMNNNFAFGGINTSLVYARI
jgi:3-oxoacyl-[acyl-carrier-protein] synthase II